MKQTLFESDDVPNDNAFLLRVHEREKDGWTFACPPVTSSDGKTRHLSWKREVDVNE